MKQIFLFALFALVSLVSMEAEAQSPPPTCIPPASGYSYQVPTEAGTVVKDLAFYDCVNDREMHIIQGYEPAPGGGVKPSQSYYTVLVTFDGSSTTVISTAYGLSSFQYNRAKNIWNTKVSNGDALTISESADWD